MDLQQNLTTYTKNSQNKRQNKRPAHKAFKLRPLDITNSTEWVLLVILNFEMAPTAPKVTAPHELCSEFSGHVNNQ